MKVLHVVGGISRDSGGPSRSVQGLVAAEYKAGVDAWVWPIREKSVWVEDVRVLASEDCCFDKLSQFDLVHLHGIWDWQLHRVARKCYDTGVPYVISPRGMLDVWPLSHKWLKKRLARLVFQDLDLCRAAALHATADFEARRFRMLGFCNPIIISPNGVNTPDYNMPMRSARRDGQRRRALFVGRMHFQKGLLELVEAWANVRPTEWMCELVYTMGTKSEYEFEARLKRRVSELGIEKSFVFTGALDDAQKWDAYARADLFVLPTYSENFGIVVAEALWAELPVITTKGTPWSLLEGDGQVEDKTDTRCGWWIDLPPTDSLVEALREAMKLSKNGGSEDSLVAMGLRGRHMVEKCYTWDAACAQMIRGYEEILKSCRRKHR